MAITDKQLEAVLAIIEAQKRGDSFEQTQDTVKNISGSTYREPLKQAPSGALRYGARGIDTSQITPENQRLIEEGSAKGVPMSEIGNYQRNPGGFKVDPRLSSGQSSALAKKYGLQGMADSQFIGMRSKDAEDFAKAIQKKKLGGVSALTSGVYNPKTIAGFKDKVNDLQFQLDKINNDPWESEQARKDKIESTVRSYTKDFASIFGTQENYEESKNSPQFQQTIEQLQQYGGAPEDIEAQIAAPQSQNIQSVDQYLGEFDSPEAQQAYSALIPERDAAQAEIAYRQSIPEQYANAYFGTEDQVGFLEREEEEANEAIKLIERRAKMDEKNARAQANFASSKYDHEMRKADAEIEKNRLNAKNYMTGMLAKMGALKTTGAAPKALMTIEQRYQEQRQNIKSEYTFAKQELDIKLNETVNNIELSRDEDILRIKDDLSNTEADIWKEVFKLQKTADEKTFGIISKYTHSFTTNTEKYRKELKTAAEKNAKSTSKIMSSYDLSTLSEGQYVRDKGVVTPSGTFQDLDLTPTQERQIEGASISGADAIRSFLSYPSGFRSWYIQQVQANRMRRDVSRSELEQSYNSWVVEQEKDDDTNTGSSDGYDDIIPD